jgi:hypothetical protein
VTYPIRGGVRERETTFTTERYTAGLVASLPFDWRATGEATFGSVQQVFEASEQRFRPQFGATLNPFGPWDEFVGAATARRSSRTDLLRVQTRYQEQALRIAGPIWTTGAGTATLTLLAERRHEKVPRYTSSIDFDDEPAIWSSTAGPAEPPPSTAS